MCEWINKNTDKNALNQGKKISQVTVMGRKTAEAVHCWS